jgi:hypothetical protein
MIFSSLRVGLPNHCDLFVDLSLFNFILHEFSDAKVSLQVSKMVTLLPYSHSLLEHCIHILSNTKKLDTYAEYLLFEMERKYFIREDNFTSEVHQQIESLIYTSDEILGILRYFWNEISSSKLDVSLKSLSNLRSSALHLKVLYLDMIEKYPNSSQLYNEFSRFLIEGLSEYKQTKYWKSRAKAIEQHKISIQDFPFLSLVNCFPSYQDGLIVTEKGEFNDTS